jgi:hypothetical protein
MQIFIEVRGGVVQSVYADSEIDAEIVLIDWDNIEQGDAEPEQPTEHNRFYIY